MGDDNTLQRDIQIHIHEHVGPLRERVGRIEGRMEVNERELGLLRQGLDSLRDRIDATKSAMLGALERHTTEEVARYEQLTAAGAALGAKVDALKNWVLAVGLGIAGVLSVLEVMARLGLLRGP
jgi:hypothetical protein